MDYTTFFALLASLVTISGVPMIVYHKVIKPILLPSVTVFCPHQINSHEHMLFGGYNPKRKNLEVWVYVFPEDGTNRYWLQSPQLKVNADGVWAQKTRFGNPNGVDMAKKPPLDFRIYAVLVGGSEVKNLPGNDSTKQYLYADNEKQFFEKLKKTGVKVISSSARLLRVPELTDNELPRIVEPRKRSVTSPFALTWEPNMTMYVEVRDGGNVVLKKEKRVNGIDLSLNPGIYEIRVKRRPEFVGCAYKWIEVLQGGAQNSH